MKGKLRRSIAERDELESSTRTQATSDIWHAEHVDGITASVSPGAMAGSKSRSPDRLVAKIMKYRCSNKPLHFDEPRPHGIQLELVARKCLHRTQRRQGCSTVLERVWLVCFD